MFSIPSSSFNHRARQQPSPSLQSPPSNDQQSQSHHHHHHPLTRRRNDAPPPSRLHYCHRGESSFRCRQQSSRYFHSWNVPEALSTLQLTQHVPPPPTKHQIQQAFTRQAKLYHPDSKFYTDEETNRTTQFPQHQQQKPCAVKFRRACEARDYLLRHYHDDGPYAQAHYRQDLHSRRRGGGGGTGGNGGTSRGRGGGSTRKFAKGFPTQTLQVLTLKQNLAIRGTVAVTILTLVAYDVFILRPRERSQHQLCHGDAAGPR